jgi:hypothetical protein
MNAKDLQPVTFGQAKRLKELGFDWIKNPCYKDGELMHEPVLTRKYRGIEDICFAAPAVSLALKWVRDEKGIICGIERYASYRHTRGWRLDNRNIEYYTDVFATYEAAESALLDELLTLLEKEKEQ